MVRGLEFRLLDCVFGTSIYGRGNLALLASLDYFEYFDYYA